mgnify:CR=1 FL=1
MNKREEEKLKRQQEKLKKELERTEAMSVHEQEHSDCSSAATTNQASEEDTFLRCK